MAFNLIYVTHFLHRSPETNYIGLLNDIRLLNDFFSLFEDSLGSNFIENKDDPGRLIVTKTTSMNTHGHTHTLKLLDTMLTSHH